MGQRVCPCTFWACLFRLEAGGEGGVHGHVRALLVWLDTDGEGGDVGAVLAAG